MRQSFDADRIPGYRADERMEAVLRFRRMWSRYRRPDDVNQLLKQFPRVSIQNGLMLDYLSLGGKGTSWIWPYARQAKVRQLTEIPEPLASVPSDRLAGMRGSDQALPLEVESLYRFLEYEQSPLGLFEYAVFVQELWAIKSEAQAAEWLDLKPLFVKHRFELDTQDGSPAHRQDYPPQDLRSNVPAGPWGRRGGEFPGLSGRPMEADPHFASQGGPQRVGADAGGGRAGQPYGLNESVGSRNRGWARAD